MIQLETKDFVKGRIIDSKSFFIPTLLPTLNEYTRASRGNIYASANMKRKTEENISFWAISQLGRWRAYKPVFLIFHWKEMNKKRDHDNVAFAKKFVQDALVKTGVIQGDGWKHVLGFVDMFSVDKEKPGVEVTILEVMDE